MELFIARQPIFDATRDVVGYELLFRNGLGNYFSAADSSDATRQVLLNTFVLFGLNRLTGGKPAFINFTRDFLFNDLVRLFPPQSIVVEVLEDIEPDADVVAACRSLKAAGYTIALDDVVDLERCGELIELCDIVKADLRATPVERRGDLPRLLRGRPLRLLAEKVETHDEFRSAANDGFALFQGYFFAKPELVQRRDVPGNRMQYLRLMRELCSAPTNMDAVERIIKQDLSLSYRLLKYVNSPLWGLRAEIGSVRHALTILGQRDFRRWATLATLACAAPDKPSELLEIGLTRARFCETLSTALSPKDKAVEEAFCSGSSRFSARCSTRRWRRSRATPGCRRESRQRCSARPARSMSCSTWRAPTSAASGTR
ncbi:MAG: HDOD domain-containing protein [Polyangiaceae bacterium]